MSNGPRGWLSLSRSPHGWRVPGRTPCRYSVPAADIALVEQKIVGDPHRFHTVVPAGGLLHRAAPWDQIVQVGAGLRRHPGGVACGDAPISVWPFGRGGYGRACHPRPSVPAIRCPARQALGLLPGEAIEIEQRHFALDGRAPHGLGIGHKGVGVKFASGIEQAPNDGGYEHGGGAHGSRLFDVTLDIRRKVVAGSVSRPGLCPLCRCGRTA